MAAKLVLLSGARSSGEAPSFVGPLHVIGAGLGRTGTASTKAALEKIYDAPCYHMAEVIDQVHMHKWQAIIDSKPGSEERIRLLREVFTGYASTVDNPACLFWGDIAKAFPNAKIVLTVRDTAGDWERSSKDTILCMMRQGPFMNFFQKVLFDFIPFWSAFSKMNDDSFEVMFKGNYTPENIRNVYSNWVEDVKSKAPKDRLLVFNVKEGYKPLCDFLDMPVPDGEFPFVNEKASFQRIITLMTVAGAAMVSVAVAATAVGAYYAVQCSKR